VNVRTGRDDASAISATTMLESIPPDRSAPSGTSASRRIDTASRTVSRTRRSQSSSLSTPSTTSGFGSQ
jgi:hypothetical protein